MSARDEVNRLADDTPHFAGSLGTEDLPEDVVSQEEDNPRRGVMAYAVNLGGREKPTLTPDEREYVAKTLEKAAKVIRDG